MTELIKVKNSSYARYEELLLRRDKLQKEAFQYEQAYIREFGDLMLNIFSMKMECIRKKKTIAYCQAAVNHGRSVDQERLQEYLREEMAEFEAQLGAMAENAENAKAGREISELDLLTIKRVYRRLAKRIHPDINPLTDRTPELADLWQRIQIAYECNNKNDMLELEVLVETALKQLGTDRLEIDIPDIDDKIEKIEIEIVKIRETDPYQYKFLLDDPEAIREKKADLKEELQSYTEYSMQLEEILAALGAKGVNSKWRMN